MPDTIADPQAFLSDVPGGVLVGVDPKPAPTTAQVAPAAPEQKFFTEEQLHAALATARDQEKSKLYTKIEEQSTQLKELLDEKKSREDAAAAARAEAERLAKEKEESELSFKELLEKRDAELRAELIREREEREAATTLLQREREYQELMEYRREQMAANQDNIMPELLDLAEGNTREEIDQSIASLVARTQRILESVQAAQQQVRKEAPGTRVTMPGTGPMENNSENRTFSPEDISKMSIGEYAKHRNKLLSSNGQGRNKGLFG